MPFQEAELYECENGFSFAWGSHINLNQQYRNSEARPIQDLPLDLLKKSPCMWIIK